MLGKKNYVRDKEFRRWIASLPCMRCGKHGTQAAHMERGGRGIKGNDSSCRPLCASSYGDIGCHARLDQHKDDFWTFERLQSAIAMPVYELWKAGRMDEAAHLIFCFRGKA